MPVFGFKTKNQKYIDFFSDKPNKSKVMKSALDLLMQKEAEEKAAAQKKTELQKKPKVTLLA